MLNNQPKVLIVEDEWILGLCLSEEVRSSGYQVIGPVASVSAAIKVIAETSIDLAILDISLGPCEKSFPIAEVLKSKGIPFLFVTGYQDDQLPEHFQDQVILQKPADAEFLKPILGSLLGIS